MDKKTRLLQLLEELSYENRQVTLTSGKTSSFYVDGKQTTLHAEGSFLTGSLALECIRAAETPIKAVGGLSMGADPIATATSLLSWFSGPPIQAFYIRKEPKGHGKNLWIEGNKNLVQGDAVAIVEDVVTSGGSLLKAIERAQLYGLQVKQVITLLDRLEGGAEMLAEKGFQLQALFTINDIRS